MKAENTAGVVGPGYKAGAVTYVMLTMRCDITVILKASKADLDAVVFLVLQTKETCGGGQDNPSFAWKPRGST